MSIEPRLSAQSIRRRRELAPDIEDAFAEFSERVFAEGALPAKVKELIAIAVAHVTQCPWCIRGHTHRAQRRGATDEEIMEAIWVAAEMRAGAAFAHSAHAVDAMGPPRARSPAPRIATTGQVNPRPGEVARIPAGGRASRGRPLKS